MAIAGAEGAVTPIQSTFFLCHTAAPKAWEGCAECGDGWAQEPGESPQSLSTELGSGDGPMLYAVCPQQPPQHCLHVTLCHARAWPASLFSHDLPHQGTHHWSHCLCPVRAATESSLRLVCSIGIYQMNVWPSLWRLQQGPQRYSYFQLGS